MKTNTIKKIIFSSVVLVLIFVFNIIFLIYTNNAIQEIGELKKEVSQESAQVQNVRDTKKKFEDLKIIEEEIDNVLIKEGGVVNFISLIEEISSNSGLDITIENVEFSSPEEEKKKLGYLDMTFQVSGSWSQVTEFLNSVEGLPYLINIDSLRLSASGDESGVLWSATFKVIGSAI